MPAIIAGIVGIIVGAGSTLLAFSLGDSSEPPPAASVQKPEPTASAPPPPPKKEPTQVELAAMGNKQAVKALEAKPRSKRTSAEALALARADNAAKREEILAMKRKIELVPKVAHDRATEKKIKEFARDSAVSNDILKMLASLPGPTGPDLLYMVWGDRRSDDARDVAEELLYSSDVRAKASKALSAVLDLREITEGEITGAECEKVLPIVKRIEEHGDRRALVPMGKLFVKRGCGDNKLKDCWSCLRDPDVLKPAVAKARSRAAP